MTTTGQLAELADEAAAYFHRIERGEETITTTRDDAPEWVRDLVYAAHGDMLPDDWRYDAIRSALDAIGETDAEEAGDLDDLGAEWADGHADVYTAAGLRWLASNLNRMGYCDEAVEEGLVEPDAGIAQRVAVGQYLEAREVWGSVVQSLADELEARGE